MTQSGGMALTFLGTGTSVGVPMIGCDCAVCHSGDPRDKRDRSSIYVETPEAAWIVDTGPDFRRQCLRFGVRRLDAVLLSHSHTDHIMGFDDVRRFTVGADDRMPVYGPPECLEMLKKIFWFAFNGENRYIGYLKPEAHPVTEPFALGATEITPLPVVHGKVQAVGYLFSRGGKKLVGYFSDVKVMPEGTLAALEGVDTLIVDALRFTEHPTHMNFDEAHAVAAKIGARQTYFTHFQCQVGHAEAEATLPPSIRLAYDGLKLEFPPP